MTMPKSILLGRQGTLVRTMRHTRLLLFAVFATFVIFYLSRNTAAAKKTPLTVPESAPKDEPKVAPKARIAKVSMAYGDNVLYDRALENHRRHAERWGYPMYTLRRDALKGYWNKPAWMLSLVVQELAKPPSESVEWIVWVDADSLMVNPAIPFEIFLPPPDLDDIHMIGTKDHNGFNSGIIFFRVHPWTVSFLADTFAYPLCRPQEDLGYSFDQEAMARLLKRPDGPPAGQGYADQTVFMPRPWINTYEFHHGYEGGKGDMLVHFPGLFEDRAPHMEKWLSELESNQQDWEVPLEETEYPNRTKMFWNDIREARNLANLVQEAIALAPEGTPTDARRQALAYLRHILRTETDNSEELHKAMDLLRVAIAQDSQSAEAQNQQSEIQ